jgi:Protein of unknown function (DUF1579)
MSAPDTTDSMPMPEPQAEHDWLRQLVGEWTVELEMAMGPDMPTEKSTGTERVRTIGDVWIVAEGEGPMPGGETANVMLTLGYDPAKGNFVGTFIGSMMTNMWVYEGKLDAANNTLTLEAEGPSMAGDGTLSVYRDVIELKSNDHRVMTSSAPGPDGEYVSFMTQTARRIK